MFHWLFSSIQSKGQSSYVSEGEGGKREGTQVIYKETEYGAKEIIDL